MEGLVNAFWRGRRVFLTGHTGFKGGWLSLWLQAMGARLTGYALAPSTQPSLFEVACVASDMQSVIEDICDFEAMQTHLSQCEPEIVFHLAAQPLVRASYQDPLGTYRTNVMGTANLLECVRSCKSVRAVVVVTTDKCYENREWPWAYREIDRLGGYDPYSSSKACAELVVRSYRNSFFSLNRYQEHGVALATARAGNVIGGGDWASDRLIADLMRGFSTGSSVLIRNPHAIRPWQHVLEPLRGYLALAQALYERGVEYAEAWNFGSHYADAKPVEWIATWLAAEWGDGAKWELDCHPHPHEAHTLKLDCSKAAMALGWQPVLSLEEALGMTLQWYRNYSQSGDPRGYTIGQIAEYVRRVDAKYLFVSTGG